MCIHNMCEHAYCFTQARVTRFLGPTGLPLQMLLQQGVLPTSEMADTALEMATLDEEGELAVQSVEAVMSKR